MMRADQHARIKHIPTRIFSLDLAMLGGVPRSQLTLVYGRESSGKTTLTLRTIAMAQRMFPDQTPVFVDVEGTYDHSWGEKHGIDHSNLMLARPHTGEQALDLTEKVIRSRETSVVVVDSLAALLPYKEMEASIEDEKPGLQARMIGKFVRKAVGAFLAERSRGHYPTLMLLNQWRMKIGVFHGDPRVLPGGRAQHFAACMKIEMLNKEHMGKDALDMETVDHNQHSFKIAKNKVGTAIRSGEFTMVRNPAHAFGQGFIDDGVTVATWAKKLGLITGGSPKLRIEGVDRTFRIRDDVVEWFYEDQQRYWDFQDQVLSRYREACGLPPEGWR